MFSLNTLIRLQYSYAFIAIGYLLLSYWRLHSVGEALSAAPIWPSVVMLVVYALLLTLPRFGKLGSYRIAMVVALVLFGGGGVIGNLVRYLDSGLAHYASDLAWAIAVAINAYGTLLNLAALLGWYRSPAQQTPAQQAPSQQA